MGIQNKLPNPQVRSESINDRSEYARDSKT